MLTKPVCIAFLCDLIVMCRGERLRFVFKLEFVGEFEVGIDTGARASLV